MKDSIVTKKPGHRFESKHHHRLDSKYRRRILPPTATLKSFGLKKEMTFCDVGAGTGYFLIPAARLIGRDARAFGVDVSREMLKMLGEKRLPKNISLVHTRNGYEFDVPSRSVNFALASAIVHENDGYRLLSEIRRTMKSGAKLLVIEWRKESKRHGPPMEERLDRVEVERLLSKSKFRVTRFRNLNARYYAVLAVKP